MTEQKKSFGVTVFPDLRPMEEIQEYLALCSKYGCAKVFTSMFSMPGDRKALTNCFKPLIDCAHQYGMIVSLDVNPECLQRMEASCTDLSSFKEIGADILRMDIPAGIEKDTQLLNNDCGIQLEYNASILNEDYLRSLQEAGANLNNMRVCHNFYPQKFTGMKWSKFLTASKVFAKYGIPVSAFVSSQAPGTHGVWDAEDGLCTVEMMRKLPMDLQARLLLGSELIDEVLIGNAYASEDELNALQECLEIKEDDPNSPLNQIMAAFGGGQEKPESVQKRIRVKLEEDITDIEKEILLDFFPHSDVGDSSEWIWRSRMPRFVYRNKSIPVRKCEKENFDVGDVVMVNDNYSHYAGEVHIVLQPIENDGKRNLVGTINKEEQKMLGLIHDHDTVIFMPEN